MSACDLAIGKPGGLSTAECLALGRPMLVVSPIPGQEERNTDYLLEHGAGLKAHDEAGVVYRIQRLLADPEHLARLAHQARGLGRPHAAETILDRIQESER